MADNYLITGYWGEPHVTAENDRGINAAIFGAGRFVLPVGNQFRAEYIGNNTIRVYDGKLIDNGAVAGIPAGQYVDLLIPETGQGLNRNDMIVFQYEKDASTLIESGVFAVVNGVETEGTATDPELTQEDILSDTATFDQMALWRVSVAGSVISDPVQVFKVAKNMENAGGGVPIVAATSTDGVNYAATVEGVEELYTGLELTIIPDMTSASTAVMLDVNGLGAHRVRIPISSGTAATTTPIYEDFYGAKKPVKLIYDASSLNGIWRIVDKNRANAIDLYGTVPVKLGGTGLKNVAVGSFLMGNGEETLVSKTAAEVAEMLNVASVQTMTTAEYEVLENKSSKTLYLLTDANEEESGNNEGNGVTVDSELSETSENPVQNKVITQAFTEAVEGFGGAIEVLASRVPPEVGAGDDGKVLTVVGGQWQAAEAPSGGGGGSITVDAELSDTSENPVQNKAITQTLNGYAEVVNASGAQISENTAAIEELSAHVLPTVSAEDNGKLLQVVDGAWTVVDVADSSVNTYIDNYISDALGGDY